MDIVIVLGCQISGLGVIRALGRSGVRIVAMAYDRSDIALASKYIHERVFVPHPIKQEQEFVDYLINNAYRWPGALIIDTDDEGTVPLAVHKQKLSQHYRIVTTDWEIARKFINKTETYALAETCGVPHPKSFWPQTLEDLDSESISIDYPCILKPVRSHEFQKTFHQKLFKVHNHAELREKFLQCQKHGHQMILQEIIPGPDSEVYICTFYINTQGELSQKVFYRKLRANPPQFGVNRVAVSIPAHAEVEALAERLMRSVDYRGICTVEFKRDPRDNQLKLIEVDARQSGPNWLPTFCGVNFPWMIYLDLVKGTPAKATAGRSGVYWIDVLPDMFNTLLHRGEENLRFKDYIRPYLARHKTFAVFSWTDIMPFLRQLYFIPVKLVKRTLARRRTTTLHSYHDKPGSNRTTILFRKGK